MANSPEDNPTKPDEDADSGRREFLIGCGRFAALTPPAMTILLSTTLSSGAIAASGGGFLPPGHGGTPPGKGGTPPGKGGTPPGKGGTPPGRVGK